MGKELQTSVAWRYRYPKAPKAPKGAGWTYTDSESGARFAGDMDGCIVQPLAIAPPAPTAATSAEEVADLMKQLLHALTGKA